jgi:hypothetical protein
MLLGRMVARQDICLRRLSEGERAQEVGFHRLLANDKVTVERLIEGWSEQTVSAVAGRHVLAIQDTSEITFATTPKRRRGLGEIGKGGGRGLLVHAMVAVDAVGGGCLGLVAGCVYTRQGRVSTPHANGRSRTRNRAAGSIRPSRPRPCWPRPPPSLSWPTAKATSMPNGRHCRAVTSIC